MSLMPTRAQQGNPHRPKLTLCYFAGILPSSTGLHHCQQPEDQRSPYRQLHTARPAHRSRLSQHLRTLARLPSRPKSTLLLCCGWPRSKQELLQHSDSHIQVAVTVAVTTSKIHCSTDFAGPSSATAMSACLTACLLFR